jgi:hypothetical protein
VHAQPSPDGRSNEKQLSSELLVLPRRRCGGAPGAQVCGLKRGLAEDQIQQRGVVRLDEEEEDFLERNVKQRGANNDMVRVTPYIGTDQIGIPRYCCSDGDLVDASLEQ